MKDRRRALELGVLVAIVLLAALLRLPGLDARGQWDADQGTDMLVLQGWVDDGEVALLGPRTSIGSFHHGALYYWLLAPSAFLSDSNPVAVTFELALIGIAAVAAIWWLARLLGGPLAAVIAGLLAALSPAGIEESTFIWNPNPIPLFAALAFTGVVLARRSGRARWWLLAGLGATGVMQLHILGAVILLPLAWAWAADLVARRRTGDAAGTRATFRGGLGALAIIAVGYLPFVAYELGHDFEESRAILAYLTGGAGAAAAGAFTRVLVVGVRSLTWPIAGVITDRPVVSLVAALIVVVLMAVTILRRRTTHAAGTDDPAAGTDDPAADEAVDTGSTRWLVGAFAICVVALALFAPSLATVTPGLPNDHYHNLLDPIVLALVGVGLARLATTAVDGRRTPGRALAAALGVVLAVIAVTATPPAVSPDGGWPIADQAAQQSLTTAGDVVIALDGIPELKNDNAMRFPLERRGADLLKPGVVAGADTWILVCDPLFEHATGAACGGLAEDAWVAAPGQPLTLTERFEAGPRRTISIYGPAPAP